MNVILNNIPKVIDLRNKIDSISDSYIFDCKSNIFSQILSFKNRKDDRYIIIGLWYLFVIEDLPSTTKTIWAYEDKQIQLSEFIKGKMAITNTWKKGWLYKDFNNFVLNILKYEDLKTSLDIEGTLVMSSFRGRNWIERLNNDENRLILEKNIHLTNEELNGIEFELYKQLNEMINC